MANDVARGTKKSLTGSGGIHRIPAVGTFVTQRFSNLKHGLDVDACCTVVVGTHGHGGSRRVGIENGQVQHFPDQVRSRSRNQRYRRGAVGCSVAVLRSRGRIVVGHFTIVDYPWQLIGGNRSSKDNFETLIYLIEIHLEPHPVSSCYQWLNFELAGGGD